MEAERCLDKERCDARVLDFRKGARCLSLLRCFCDPSTLLAQLAQRLASGGELFDTAHHGC
jgi:hypothetical protein